MAASTWPATPSDGQKPELLGVAERCHLGVVPTLAGEDGPEEEPLYTGEVGDNLIGLVGSPVWSFQSSSSLVRLSLFFSWVSFSTYSWRLAFSSDSCLHGRE